VPAVAVNVAVVAPARTVTEAGTVRLALLLESETDVLEATADVIVTVQLEVPPEFNVVGAQPTLLRAGGVTTEMLPPVPLAETLLPLGAAADTFVTAMFTVPEAVADRVALTTATTPLAIAV